MQDLPQQPPQQGPGPYPGPLPGDGPTWGAPPQGPHPGGPGGPGGASGAGGPSTGLVVGLISLVVLLVIASTGAVVQTLRLSDAREELVDLRTQVRADGDRIAELERELAEAQAAAEAAEAAGSLDGLLGEGGLEDLLGEGGLDGLLGEGGLEGLLGEGGLEDLEGLLGGGGAAPDVSACLDGIPEVPRVEGATLQEQLDQTAQVVQDLRRLELPEPVEPEVLSGEEVRRELEAIVTEGYPADVADAERRILSLLQAIPADTDLVQTQIDLLGDQVAGYYDDETGRLVVRADSGDEPLGATGLITLAHEIEHALVDAVIGLPSLETDDGDDDRAVAALAVVEGSAVGLMTQFQVAALDPLALLGDLGSGLGADQGLDQVPPYIRQSLLFPYVAGPSYVCERYAAGGWAAVDQVLADPPATSHQVLWPEDAVTAAAEVPQPGGPAGMDLVDRRTFGAAQLSWLLSSPGMDEAAAAEGAAQRARAWRGGEVSLWTQGEDSAVALVLQGEGLCGALTDWWTAATPGGATEPAEGAEQVVSQAPDGTWGVVSCDGPDVRVGAGTSPQVARDAIR